MIRVVDRQCNLHFRNKISTDRTEPLQTATSETTVSMDLFTGESYRFKDHFADITVQARTQKMLWQLCNCNSNNRHF
jgi:hypothetical protein